MIRSLVARRNRVLVAELLEHGNVAAVHHANDVIARYEATIASLVDLHRARWSAWDWKRVKESPPPEEPAYPSVREPRAQAALDGYAPSLVDRVVGRDVVRRSALAAAVETAREADRASFVAALDAHCRALARWEWFRKVAAGVLSGAPEAYAAVLGYLSPFGQLREVIPNVSARVVSPTTLEAGFVARGLDVVPSEEPLMRKSGLLVTRSLSRQRRLTIHRDHVASAALRLGRELFALLPIELALVNVRGLVLNRSTGFEERAVLLSIALARPTMDRLRFETLAPFAALEHFVHRVDFRPRAGLAPVEALSAATLRRPLERPVIPDVETMMLGI